ncbi:MAG: tyrosine--tRNA ligase [Patescibacteria group bacterium]
MNSDLLTRAVSNIYPASEKLKSALESGQKLRIYFGIDPTGPTLHVGHLSVLLKLRDLQNLGEQIKIVILFGDFTAQIGDPTDKSAVRKMLTPETISENLKNYREQIGKILDLEKTEFRNNSEWLAKLGLEKLLPLASEFTVSQMLERDMFQERIKKESPIYLHEFLYPLLQGYDSVVLEVDMEIGGNDQTFNMLVGRDLLKKLKSKEKFVLATKLLTDSGGEKMGKTTGNMVAFADTPTDAYGKVMSWPDSLLPLAFELCTRLSDEEVKNILAGHPKEAKMKLAHEIVTLIHDSKLAGQAEESFVQTFQKEAEPTEWQELTGKAGEKISEILVSNSVVKSKTDFRNLVEAGAVEEWPNKNPIVADQIFTAEIKLRIGKKRFVRIRPA